MKNKIKIEITLYDTSFFLKKMIEKNIEITNIRYLDKRIYCTVNYKDYLYLKKLYPVKVLSFWNLKRVFHILKNHYLEIILFFLSFLYFLWITHLIMNVTVETDNEELRNNLVRDLEDVGLKHLSLQKEYQEISEIKENLLGKWKDQIEWLEIEQVGMDYVVKLEERKKNSSKNEEEYCNVISEKEGIVTNIEAQNGVVIVKKGDYVHIGDVLISGDINLDEETKQKVCAKGTVYGEVWYTVNLSIPKIYKEKVFTGKKRTNLSLAFKNSEYVILKSRLGNHEEDKKKIFQLFGVSLNLIKEYEYEEIDKTYTEEELENKINYEIEKNLNINLEEKESILYKKVLHQSDFDSKIDIEVFVTVEKILSS